MIRQEFLRVMKNLKDLENDIRSVHVALKKLDPDFGGFFISRVPALALDILKIAMEDKSNWIEYYIYEMDWGTRCKENSVTDKNGDPIPFRTVDDLYDCITKRK